MRYDTKHSSSINLQSSLTLWRRSVCFFRSSMNNLSKWITIEWKFNMRCKEIRHTDTKMHGANKSKRRIFRLHHYYVRCTWMPSSPSRLGVWLCVRESFCVISGHQNKLQQQQCIQYKLRFIASCPKHVCESMGRCQWDRYYYVYAERTLRSRFVWEKLTWIIICFAQKHIGLARERVEYAINVVAAVNDRFCMAKCVQLFIAPRAHQTKCSSVAFVGGANARPLEIVSVFAFDDSLTNSDRQNENLVNKQTNN